MNYAINYSKSGDTYEATFPDFPHIHVTASSAEGIQVNAYEALIAELMSYMDTGRVAPVPQAEPNPSYMPLPPSLGPKILLHNLLVEQNKSRAWLSRQMGVSRQVMTRMFTLRETTKVETIQNGLDALGYEMVITVRPRPR
ncbi:hypothetical protein NAD41_000868 [Salmonella enterica]|nr:hypothetical protein [Salmonella enterica]EKK6596252.1 hypothetical protein [Salmonella enterica]